MWFFRKKPVKKSEDTSENDVNVESFIDRLDEIERKVNRLERYYYRHRKEGFGIDDNGSKEEMDLSWLKE